MHFGIHQILNVVLLALTISTILLTLVSFILYKMRQLPEGGKRMPGRRIEGVFFKRYFPGPKAADHPPEAEAGRPPFKQAWLTAGTGAFFAVTVLVVLSALLFQQYLNQSEFDRTRGDSALTFRELQKQGLLRTYDFMPKSAEGIRDEFIADGTRKALAQMVAALKRKRIQLAGNGKSTAGWRETLRRHGIAATGGDRPDVLVFAASGTLDRRDAKRIEAALKRGTSVVLTGFIGEDGAGWAKSRFGVGFAPSSHPDTHFPTQFAAGSPAGWEVPAGWIADWLPPENRLVAYGVEGTPAAYESTYRGQLNRVAGAPVVRVNFLEKGARRVWFASGPAVKAGAAPSFHGDSAAIASLAWAAKVPGARIAEWKEGHRAAAVISVDGEDKFENLDRLTESLKEAKVPATFFVVSRLLQKYPSLIERLPSNVEVASHSEDHGVFQGQPSEKQFDRLQVSRFEIEELTRKKVHGFRPPEEKFDDQTLQAALQNGLSYFSGDNGLLRFSPAWIAGGKLLLFPRVPSDDFLIHHRRDMASADDVANLLEREMDGVSQLRGAYFLSLHSHVFGQAMYRAPFERALAALNRKDVWKTNYASLAEWWAQRLSVETELSGDELTVTNRSSSAAEGVVVEVDPGGKGPFTVVEAEARSLAQAGSGAGASVEEGRARVRLATLAPGESRRFKIRFR